MYIASLLAFLLGLAVYFLGAGPLNQVEALVLFLISAVFWVGSVITESLEKLRKQQSEK